MLTDLQKQEKQITPSVLLADFEQNRTTIELLYTCIPFEFCPDKPTIVCLTGTSGSGKDTIMEPLVDNGTVRHVKTATSRARRYKLHEWVDPLVEEDLNACKTREEHERKIQAYAEHGYFEKIESPSAYVWMRWKRDDESDEAYYSSLVDEYGLVEHDRHYSGVYGLPLSSLEATSDSSAIPLLRIDINGVQHIRELLSERFNILAIGVIPDTWEQVAAAISERESGLQVEEKIAVRLAEDRVSIARYSECINFVVQNHRGKVGDVDGKVYAQELLSLLLRSVI